MKTYEKPVVHFESFELSKHIASCGWVYKNNTDPTSCYAEGNTYDAAGNPVTVFYGSNCSVTDAYCYWNGSSEEEGMAALHSS